MMRRLLAVLLLIALLLPSVAVSDTVIEDLSAKTDGELYGMYAALMDEMLSRGLMVYISPSGSKYHNKTDCGSMSEALLVEVDDAEDAGYDPCKKCYKKKKN